MGGRGVRSYSDKSRNNFSKSGLGTRVASTLREAIGTKGKPQSIAQASKGANPLFSREHSEYSENCQRVVVAYELRRRGYKVYAQPTFSTDTMGVITYVDRKRGTMSSRWSGAFQHAKIENVGARSGQKMVQNVNAKMAQYGEGSRAVLQIQWKAGGGHVFNVERVRGKTIYVDAQVNKRYSASYLASMVKPGSVNIVRTDNLRISERAKKSVTTRRY